MTRAVNRKRLAAEIKSKELPLSTIALEIGVSRRKLSKYLENEAELTEAQAIALKEAVEFEMPTPANPLSDKLSRNRQINEEIFSAVSDDLIRHNIAYVVNGNDLASGTLVEIAGR